MNKPSAAASPSLSNSKRSTDAAERLVATLRIDQRERWRSGERILVEAYLEQHSVLRSYSESLLDLIYHEIVLREERDETPQLAEYLERFPQLASQLQLQFEVHEAIHLEQSADAHPPENRGTSGDTQTLATTVVRPTAPSYEILGELGRGGMGVVFKARQKRANRVVALKVILSGTHAGERERARFRAEAEAVASLQHANIVQIHEVGEHDGQPFFSLEFVDGGNLTQKLHSGPLAARSAAQLVETLAGAVHYAHERGVLHRDLKPSNVLLTADGVPKITDFGLAKRLDDATGQTSSGALVGTPSYMAPEQAASRAAQVGPATDVYALGAILYETLAGRPPHHAASLLETLAEVCFVEPVPPRQLQPGLPRDLETICLKCLQKEPDKRYGTAAALADDLHRFLEGRSIRARPVGMLGLAVRSCRRKPLVAGLLFALVLVFAGGFAGVVWQWRRATEQAGVAQAERDSAVKEQARAEANFARAREVVDRLTRVGEDLSRQPRMDKTSRTLLDEVLVFHQGFLQEKGADPGVRFEAARACVRVGMIHVAFRRWDEAVQHFEQAKTILERLTEEDPSSFDYQYERAFCLTHMGHMLTKRGQDDNAKAFYQQAVVRWDALNAAHPDQASVQDLRANTLANLATVLSREGRLEEARATVNPAIELCRKLVAAAPRDPAYRFELALCLETLAWLEWKEGRKQAAEDAGNEAVGLLRKVVAQRPDSADNRYHFSRAYNTLGTLLRDSGKRAAIEQAYRAALPIVEKLVDEYPATPDYQLLLIDNLFNLGASYSEPEQFQEAIDIQRRGLACCTKLAAAFPGEASYRQSLANCHVRHAALLRRAGRREEALESCRQALGLQPDYPAAHNQMAWIMVAHHDPQSDDRGEAVQLAQKAVQRSPRVATYHNTLGVAHYRHGDYQAAVKALEAAMRLRSGESSEDWYFLSMSLWQLGDRERALKWYDQATEWTEKNRPQDAELRRFGAEAQALLTGTFQQ